MTKDEFIFKKIWPDRCWHKFFGNEVDSRCEKCGFLVDYCSVNPDFSSAEGFFMLLKGMQERADWINFHRYLHNNTYGRWDYYSVPWIYIDPPAFRDACWKWLGGEGEHERES